MDISSREIQQKDYWNVYHDDCPKTTALETEGTFLRNLLEHGYCVFCGKDVDKQVYSKLEFIYLAGTLNF